MAIKSKLTHAVILACSIWSTAVGFSMAQSTVNTAGAAPAASGTAGSSPAALLELPGVSAPAPVPSSPVPPAVAAAGMHSTIQPALPQAAPASPVSPASRSNPTTSSVIPRLPAPGTPAVANTAPSAAIVPSAPIAASTALPPAVPVVAQIAAQLDGADKKDAVPIPIHLGEESLMFSKNDMEILKPFVEAYDSIHTQKTDMASGDKDDLRSLLQSLKSQDDTAAASAKPPPLVNLYLGSILYYSPRNWSVWINGKKLLNKNNIPGSEFFVSELSRKEIVLVWKPLALQDTTVLWQQMTNNGKKPLSDITVDESRGTITLHMHTNQTFLPRSLTMREGLILSVPTADVTGNKAAASDAESAAAPDGSPHVNLPATPSFLGEIHR